MWILKKSKSRSLSSYNNINHLISTLITTIPQLKPKEKIKSFSSLLVCFRILQAQWILIWDTPYLVINHLIIIKSTFTECLNCLLTRFLWRLVDVCFNKLSAFPWEPTVYQWWINTKPSRKRKIWVNLLVSRSTI